MRAPTRRLFAALAALATVPRALANAPPSSTATSTAAPSSSTATASSAAATAFNSTATTSIASTLTASASACTTTVVLESADNFYSRYCACDCPAQSVGGATYASCCVPYTSSALTPSACSLLMQSASLFGNTATTSSVWVATSEIGGIVTAWVTSTTTKACTTTVSAAAATCECPDESGSTASANAAATSMSMSATETAAWAGDAAPSGYSGGFRRDLVRRNTCECTGPTSSTGSAAPTATTTASSSGAGTSPAGASSAAEATASASGVVDKLYDFDTFDELDNVDDSDDFNDVIGFDNFDHGGDLNDINDLRDLEDLDHITNGGIGDVRIHYLDIDELRHLCHYNINCLVHLHGVCEHRKPDYHQHDLHVHC
ncbi:hypothetical protein Q5752_006374 [Cryptotrichosporon argae]